MELDKVSNNIQKDLDNNIQDAIIIIDMNKLPEEIREKFPKDLQDELMELLQADQQYKSTKNTIVQNGPDVKSQGLFTIQQGYVIGNIYNDDTLTKEKQT